MWLSPKQIESPYYMRRPDDLHAFLQQSENLNRIATLNAKLLKIKTELIRKMQQSNTYSIEYMYQTECINIHFLQDFDLFSTLTSKKYLNRFADMQPSPRAYGADELEALRNALPTCADVPFSLTCMEHLESMANRTRLRMDPEHSLADKELDLFTAPLFAEKLVLGMRNEPHSWRHPLLSSYYWRARGSAPQAMACARRALFLAPRKYKDMALLSLGTVLQRSSCAADALVVLVAARDHAPHEPENQVAAANAYFLVSDFARSLHAYDVAGRQDESHGDRGAHIRQSMKCFRFIKSQLRQIERQLIVMQADLVTFVRDKQQLNEYYAKLLEEQVPIAQRLAEDRTYDAYAHQLRHRSQFCAVRPPDDGTDFSCDFYSELQTQLSTKDPTIDTIQTYIDTKMVFIRNQWELSLGVYKHLNIETFEGDPMPKVERDGAEGV